VTRPAAVASHLPHYENASRAQEIFPNYSMKIGRLRNEFARRKIFLKKIVLERNKVWTAVFQLLGALNLPPSPSALFCPASALPARGFFFAPMIVPAVGWPSRLAPMGRRVKSRVTASTVVR
jgi:hypothetical protein